MALSNNTKQAANSVQRKMDIQLTSEERGRLIKEIQHFFSEERDEELGIIAAETILDFFTGDLGSIIYNKALDDAKIWLIKRMENTEVDYDMLYK